MGLAKTKTIQNLTQRMARFWLEDFSLGLDRGGIKMFGTAKSIRTYREKDVGTIYNVTVSRDQVRCNGTLQIIGRRKVRFTFPKPNGVPSEIITIEEAPKRFRCDEAIVGDNMERVGILRSFSLARK